MLETVPCYLSESPGLLYSSSRSSPIFSIASPNPVLTLIIFYEKSAERGICGICCYLIELSHDKAKLSQHVIQILINFRHSKPREDYQNHLYNILSRAHLLVSPSTWLSMLPRFLLFLLENSSVDVFT